MRNLIKSRSGFTLVELMVVVVVLGILAGIAVQRMGDVRDRAETAAREANTRLLLGAANLALTRNYGDYMYSWDIWDRNGVIRWQRPCEKPAVTQYLGQIDHVNSYVSGYNNFAGEDGAGPWAPGGSYSWTPNQDWCLTDYLESFPVGYTIEIVFPPIYPAGGGASNTNEILRMKGYHIYRDEGEAPPGDGNPQDTEDPFLDPDNPYNVPAIYIYKFIGDEITEGWPVDFDPLNPPGTNGEDYPYHGTFNDPTSPLNSSDWREVFPVDRW